jgi:hypothetical protein
VGLTDTEVAPVTLPTPLLTLREVAFPTFHESVDDCPEKIDVGLATNEEIVGSEALWVLALARKDFAEVRPSVS